MGFRAVMIAVVSLLSTPTILDITIGIITTVFIMTDMMICGSSRVAVAVAVAAAVAVRGILVSTFHDPLRIV